MANFRKVTNKLTGAVERQFDAKLISVAETPMQNKSTGKDYYPCTIEFVNSNAEVVQRTAIIYGANWDKGMEVGESYMTTAQKVGEAIYLHVSHLKFINGATDEDFDGLFEDDAEVEVVQPREKAVAEFN